MVILIGGDFGARIAEMAHSNKGPRRNEPRLRKVHPDAMRPLRAKKGAGSLEPTLKSLGEDA